MDKKLGNVPILVAEVINVPVLVTEVITIRETLKMASDCNINNILIEKDLLFVITSLRGLNKIMSQIINHIIDIVNLVNNFNNISSIIGVSLKLLSRLRLQK